MSKKLVSILLIFTLLFSMSSISMGAPGANPRLVLDNKNLSLEQEIYLNDSKQIMVPLRAVAEKLNYVLSWNNTDKCIELKNSSRTVKLKIGKPNVSIDNIEISLSSAPVLKNDKTFIPVEVFSKALGLIVGWDTVSGKLNITQPKENKEEFFQISKEDKIIQELETYINALIEKENFHGSILVAQGGKLLINSGYGLADFSQNTLNKPGTRFAIGSVSKQFTAMAIMQLVEKNLISLDDKVSKYIPKMPHADLITIKNLLTHTSGLENFTNVNGFFLINSEKTTPKDMLDLIKDLPLEYTPGDGFKYSNTNYLVLGMIVEKITDMSLENYLDKNIFTPLNMTNTGTAYGESNNIHDATAYAGYLDVVPIDDSTLLKKAFGAGNLYSTVEDLYRWDRALNTEKIVKKETLAKIFTEYIDVTDDVNYGLGWMIEQTEKGKEIYHGGNTLGFTSNIARYIDEDLTVIVLTNNGYYDVEAVTEDLSSIVLHKEYKMPVGLVEVKLENYDIYDKYIGKYSFMQGSFIEITRVENKLYAQATGQGPFEIFPRAIDDFFARIADINIKFVEIDGIVDMFIFNQLGLEMECYKTEPEDEKKVVEIDTAIYKDYIGEYELAPGTILTITQVEKNIFAQVTGQENFQIYPMSNTEYFYKVIDATITFNKDEKGKVVNLVLKQMGQEIPAKKIK